MQKMSQETEPNMNTITLEAKYTIGEVVEIGGRLYRLIGYEYIPERALRYIFCIGTDSGDTKWVYLFQFEIDALLQEEKLMGLHHEKNNQNENV